MRALARLGIGVAVAAALAWTNAPQQPAPAVQGALTQGVKVTFARLAGGDGAAVRQSQSARLLSLAVERGETPTPFLAPGLFQATYAATLQLPARDRCRFRAEGRGSLKLAINGVTVLDGQLRASKSLETAEPAKLKKGDNELVLVFESTAMGDGQFRLFWSGSDFGYEPIAPERLLRAADDADVRAGEERRAAFELFAERRCARCHEYETQRIGESAFGELDAAGPDLRSAGARLHADWIAAWLAEPRRFRPDATMPKFALTAAECGDLAAYLASLGAPAAPPKFAPDAPATGKQLFRQLGCVACHVEPGTPASPQLPGRLEFAFVARKWQPQGLVEFLCEPKRSHPDLRMPDLRLSRDEAERLAAFLLANDASGALPKASGDAGRGKRLAQKHGCAICHGLDVPLADRPFARLRNVKPDRGCLAETPNSHGAPDHDLTKEQRAGLRAFLAVAEEVPFRRAPLDFVQRHFTRDQCTSCHALDGRPSMWARWAEQQNAVSPLPKDHDPIASGVPALTWVGSKLQPSWLEKFVSGEGKSPRPWLRARMPGFARHGQTLAQGLVREHGYGPQDEPSAPVDPVLAGHGERLVAQGTGFNCVQCHAVGDKPAVQVFEREGIEMLTARTRLRHEYYQRWLADPRRLDPDAKMPQFAPNGKSPFTDVLDGDGPRQFEAIWHWLGGRAAGK